MKKIIKIWLFCGIIFCFACESGDFSQKENETENGISQESPVEQSQNLTITFAGDLMAHDVNFMMKNYRHIYTDLADILLQDDLSFCNIEMPVCEEKPLSSYPSFNVHRSYIRAAIDSGFDVFALANNHTNDQGKSGIAGSITSFETLEAEYKTNGRRIYYSGLKKTKTDAWEPVIIEKNGFTLLFLSVTELLNSYGDSKHYLYYSEPTAEGRTLLLERISEMREKYPCDILILTLHVAEAEYGFNVSTEKKRWFKRLGDAGVDIICASHPHVMQTWEKVESTRSPLLEAQLNDGNFGLHSYFFMYSMGNFISGQRMKPNYENPKHYREYTGDAVLLQLTLHKRDGKILNDYELRAIPVTVYKNEHGLVMKRLDQNFIDGLFNEKEKTYYRTRLNLLKAYLPL